jgi:hypothetical protein
LLLKAQNTCENSGNDPADHFIGASKMVAIGSDAKREVEDMHLSRYACYLVVQNADPAKEVVALGQTYFAVQTRRQELGDAGALGELTEDQRRLLLRQRIKMQNTDAMLASPFGRDDDALDHAVAHVIRDKIPPQSCCPVATLARGRGRVQALPITRKSQVRLRDAPDVRAEEIECV